MTEALRACAPLWSTVADPVPLCPMTDVLYTPACATSALAAALWLMLERLRMPFWFTVALAPSADWSINETLLRYSVPPLPSGGGGGRSDRKSTRLNSSH